MSRERPRHLSPRHLSPRHLSPRHLSPRHGPDDEGGRWGPPEAVVARADRADRTDAERPPSLVTNQYEKDSVRILAITGECDLATHDFLQAALTVALLITPSRLIVDLSRVRFCDAGCAGLLLSITIRSPVTLVGCTGEVERLFSLLDPYQRLPRHRTVDEALAADRSAMTRQVVND